MTDTTTPAQLVVPPATYKALGGLGIEWDSWAHLDEAARAVAAPIVAAELRRIATEGVGGGLRDVLYRRADELDGGRQ